METLESLGIEKLKDYSQEGKVIRVFTIHGDKFVFKRVDDFDDNWYLGQFEDNYYRRVKKSTVYKIQIEEKVE